MIEARAHVDRVMRALVPEHHGWVLARLVRSVRDLELAEDARARAREAAVVQWPSTRS
ncbi:MAG: RNA polymerase sigma factor, partial [Deltaproteobacteria bacterium]|nr:RNA polymerase sigma factor [Nannocystaceae bacterium]